MGVSVGPIPYPPGVSERYEERRAVSRERYGVSSKRYEKRKWPSVWAAVGAVLLAVLVAALAGYTIMRDARAPTSVPRVSATSG
jgi:ABC-type glycerol-3-phosphate transport system permease component